MPLTAMVNQEQQQEVCQPWAARSPSAACNAFGFLEKGLTQGLLLALSQHGQACGPPRCPWEVPWWPCSCGRSDGSCYFRDSAEMCANTASIIRPWALGTSGKVTPACFETQPCARYTTQRLCSPQKRSAWLDRAAFDCVGVAPGALPLLPQPAAHRVENKAGQSPGEICS